jgi:signal transduction histidine kinase
MRKKSIEQLNTEQMLLAKQAAKGIEEFFSHYESLLFQYAAMNKVIDFEEEGKHALKHVYDFNSKQIRAITYYDNTGKIIYTYPENKNVIGKNISSQPHVKKILTTQKPNASDVFKAVQGFTTIALSVPVFKDKEFIGVIGILIDFQHLAQKFIENIKVKQKGYAWIISKDGTKIHCKNKSHIGKNIKTTSDFPSIIKLAERMSRGEQGFGTYTYFESSDNLANHVTKHVAFTPIKVIDNNWSIAVATPEDEAYSNVSGFYTRVIIILIAIILIIALYFYVNFKYFKLQQENTSLEIQVNEETEKRKKQERIMLQQAKFASMGEMISAIAHQWRQPLTAIGLNIQDIDELTRENYVDFVEIQFQVKKSMEIIKHMSKTIDDFRYFFMPHKDVATFDLKNTIKSIENIVSAQLLTNNITLSYTFESENKNDNFLIASYEGELKQVLLNIIQNARDAIISNTIYNKTENGIINIKVSKQSENYIIDIDDNGGGIPEDILEKIFDPYFSTKESSLGTGIGLFMSKMIIEEHMNGRITAKNTKDGAKFTVII